MIKKFLAWLSPVDYPVFSVRYPRAHVGRYGGGY